MIVVQKSGHHMLNLVMPVVLATGSTLLYCMLSQFLLRSQNQFACESVGKILGLVSNLVGPISYYCHTLRLENFHTNSSQRSRKTKLHQYNLLIKLQPFKLKPFSRGSYRQKNSEKKFSTLRKKMF